MFACAPPLRFFLQAPAAFPQRHSAQERCEKSKLRARSTPQRHSREGGNPFLALEQDLSWVPAGVAPGEGTTPRPCDPWRRKACPAGKTDCPARR